MEALGAVSSILTVLEISLKTAGFLHDISETQNDFKDLKQYLTDIDGIIKRFRSIPALFAATPGLPEIAEELSLCQAITQLQEIREEVDAIVMYCAQYPDDENSRAKKRKWILKRNTVPKLLDKARNAQRKVETALQVQTFTLIATKTVLDNRFQSECLMALQALQNIQRASISLPATSRVVQGIGLPPDNILQPCNDDGTQVEDPKNNTTMEPRSHKVSTSDFTRQSRTGRSDGQASRTHPQRHGLDTQECRRRCHSQRYYLQGPSWVRPILGTWHLAYTPGYPADEIDNPHFGCNCTRETRVNMQYHLPRWLCARTLLLVAAYSTGGLSFALRPTRVLSANDSVWRWAAIGHISPHESEALPVAYGDDTRKFLTAYFPADCDESGETLMEYAVTQRSFSIIELLLKHWRNLLLKHPLPRRTGQMACWFIQEEKSFDDHSLYLLEQVVSCSDMPEQKSAKVLEAGGVGMVEAIEAEPWTINELDDTGCAPIHYAVLNRDTESLKTLIKAKADLNSRESSNLPPLDLAAYIGNTEAMSLLIAAGCALNQNSLGSSALHCAARGASPDAIAVLLAAGASAFVKDLFGQTPLHRLGYDLLELAHGKDHDNVTDTYNHPPDTHSDTDSTNCPESTLTTACDTRHQRLFKRLSTDVKRCINLLLVSNNTQLEARDVDGSTPLMQCVRLDNTHVLHHLVEAGASMHTTRNNDQNVLHMAARNANAETLQFLLRLDPSTFRGINIELRDRAGNTPWSLFTFHCRGEPNSFFLPYGRNPSKVERCLFIQLFEMIRIENLCQDIDLLEDSMKYLREGRYIDAEGQLNVLLDKEKGWGRSDLTSWYQGLIQSLHTEELELVEDAIVDYINDLHGEMKDSLDEEFIQWVCNLGQTEEE